MPKLSREEVLEIVRAAREKGKRPNLSGGEDLRSADLIGADLSGANLIGADLSKANLSGADFSGADLGWANLSRTRLSEADLSRTRLSGANLSRANLNRANLSRANLSRANLNRANLSGADISGADISGADISEASLSEADLSEASLSEADLSRADLIRADLIGADLSGANLNRANLSGANLSGADLRRAFVAGTTFGDVDLSSVEGLDTVYHRGPSTIGIDTLYLSKGKIPEAFLRGAGVPDTFMASIASLTGQAIQYYSCFISYSSKDQAFAERLHNDLQAKGVRCWYAPEDMKIGDEIRPRIDESIRIHDKLLIILSEHSINSVWVKKEVETAFEEESKRNQTVLVPVRLDKTVMETGQAWAADIRRTRHIGDFGQWKKPDVYQTAFDRLLRDLKAEA